MYVVGYKISYDYHSEIIKLVTTYNNNFLLNHLVLDALLPKAPPEVTAFRSIMRTFIQDKKCISLVYGPDKEYPDKRFLQWVLEAINILQNLVSKMCYNYRHNNFRANV